MVDIVVKRHELKETLVRVLSFLRRESRGKKQPAFGTVHGARMAAGRKGSNDFPVRNKYKSAIARACCPLRHPESHKPKLVLFNLLDCFG